MTSDLIDRLSKLDAPDRELDTAIWLRLVEKPGPNDKIDRDMIGRYPRYTASVDAALALSEMVLPNKRVRLKRIEFDGKCQWRASFFGGVASWSSSPAIALCLAILRSKESSHAE